MILCLWCSKHQKKRHLKTSTAKFVSGEHGPVHQDDAQNLMRNSTLEWSVPLSLFWCFLLLYNIHHLPLCITMLIVWAKCPGLTNNLWFVLELPLAGGTLAVWVYGLEVLCILLLFNLKRSPRHQGRAKPLREEKVTAQFQSVWEMEFYLLNDHGKVIICVWGEESLLQCGWGTHSQTYHIPELHTPPNPRHTCSTQGSHRLSF